MIASVYVLGGAAGWLVAITEAAFHLTLPEVPLRSWVTGLCVLAAAGPLSVLGGRWSSLTSKGE